MWCLVCRSPCSAEYLNTGSMAALYTIIPRFFWECGAIDMESLDTLTVVAKSGARTDRMFETSPRY